MCYGDSFGVKVHPSITPMPSTPSLHPNSLPLFQVLGQAVLTGERNHYPACLEKKQCFNSKRPEKTAGSNEHLQVPGEVMQGEADPPFRLQNSTIKEAADSTRLFTRFPGSLVKEALCQIKSFLYLILQGLGGLEGMLFLFGMDPSRPQWSDSTLGYHCLGTSCTCWMTACCLPLTLNIKQNH